jgi:WD40 repeat protein
MSTKYIYYSLVVLGFVTMSCSKQKFANPVDTGNKIEFNGKLTLIWMTDTTITMKWQSNLETITGFEIEQSTDGINYTLIKTISGDIHSITIDGNFNENLTYFFRIRGRYDQNFTNYSNSIKMHYPQQRDLITLSSSLPLAFSPDGQTLVSASSDSTLTLWRTSDGGLIKTLTGHSDRVNSASFSPDGTTIASGSDDKTIKLWRTSDGSLIKTLPENSPVYSVAFSPDGQTIASGNGNLTFWRTADGSILRSIVIDSFSFVTSVAFSPDGKTIACSTFGNNSVNLLNASDGEILKSLTGPTEYINSVVFSPDGQTIVTGSNNEIILWKTSDGSLINTLAGIANSLSFTPDGQIIASLGGGKLNLWRSIDGSLIQSYFEGLASSTGRVSISPNGEMIANTSYGIKLRTLKYWQIMP